MGKLLGKAVSDKITNEVIEKVKMLKSKDIIPTLLIIRVGERSDDIYYERATISRMGKCGINVRTVKLPENVAQEVLEEAIISVNNDDSDGILLFEPLPKHINSESIHKLISPKKDIDCINPKSHIKLYEGSFDGFMPCTPMAVMEIIDYYKIPLEGRRVALLGRSLVVGKPLFLMLLNKNATITLCHSKTLDLDEILLNSDIVISAIGKPNFVLGSQIKKDAYIIDVGINNDDEGNLVGDVNYKECIARSENITPVPGGVGSVTTSVLAKQVVLAAMKNKLI